MFQTTNQIIEIVEFSMKISNAKAIKLINEIDAALYKSNIEYASKRNSMRLAPPVLRIVRQGEFEKYRKRKIESGNSDGTFKILRLTDNYKFVQEFQYECDVKLAEAEPSKKETSITI